jgi:hypothetical protein
MTLSDGKFKENARRAADMAVSPFSGYVIDAAPE